MIEEEVPSEAVVKRTLELAAERARPASSNASTGRLRAAGITVLDLNDVDELGVYVDGADEATRDRYLIKGGGATLTREKIVAAAAAQFVCIAEKASSLSGWVRVHFPLK